MSYRIAIIGLLIAVVGAIVTLVLPQPMYAHGSGLTLTATTSEYIVDVDYNSFSVVAGDGGFFAFQLYSDTDRTEPVEFTSAWVRISAQVETADRVRYDTIFSGQITRALLGSTGFSITLPKSGPYMLTVRYYRGEDELVDTSIPFTVEPPYDERTFNYSPEFWIGLCGGGLLVLLLGASYIFRSRIVSLFGR